MQSENEDREGVFDVIWDVLAKEGICDALCSAEYTRVKTAWRADGRPMGLFRYITDAANLERPADVGDGNGVMRKLGRTGLTIGRYATTARPGRAVARRGRTRTGKQSEF
jgi:hypothetical protein